jgi:hypothetical protein
MSGGPRVIDVGELLPPVPLMTASGEEVSLARWSGRPLLVVCVRYYG